MDSGTGNKLTFPIIFQDRTRILMVFTVFFLIMGIFNAVVSADKLPSSVAETQKITIDTLIDAIGSLDEETRMNLVTTKNASASSFSMGKGSLISSVIYTDTLLSNGGSISAVKNTGFDTSSVKSNLYNVDSEKVFSYTGTDGALLTGHESLMLLTAGNYSSSSSDSEKCVLISTTSSYTPAFCNAIRVQGTLTNINDGQVSTKSQLTSIGSSNAAELTYLIAITPDSSQGQSFAKGSVRTEFAGSIIEARDKKTGFSSRRSSSSSDTWKTPAATNEWKDVIEIIGGIKTLQKAYSYKSGVKV